MKKQDREMLLTSLDAYKNENEQLIHGLGMYIQEWNDPSDVVTRCAKLIIYTIERHNTLIDAVNDFILRHDQKCSHPKRYHQVHKNVKYCSNCNQNLP